MQWTKNGKAVDVFIVSSYRYAPTPAHSEAEWEAYYDALSAALAMTAESHYHHCHWC